MSALPRPDLPQGALRDVNDALHDLHHRAGWPSLRAMAGQAACSHTTVSAVFSSAKLPSWGVLELLVEALGGDTGEFRALWVAASVPGEALGGQPLAAGTAGRRPDLARVRRHLDEGLGLLLVVGEAGIGKSHLVRAAAAGGECFVAEGRCLPLSREVPLLPVVDALRAVLELDGGQWLRDAVNACPAYVAGTMQRILPDLDYAQPRLAEDEWSRHQLYGALAATLAALRLVRPLALVLEDLHWADTTTLDLVEHLLSRGSVIPLVGTWRDDPDTGSDQRAWLSRLRRSTSVAVMELSPLTLEETTAQLQMLRGAPVDSVLVERIHARAQGHPLFTEQLAAQVDDQSELPQLLADLLDQRLDRLDADSWKVARTLGVAERPLPFDVLEAVTELAPAALTEAQHRLFDHRLLGRPGHRSEATPDPPVQLAHPLLTEAVRARLVPGEAADQHRRLAGALALTATPEPSEIARHWQLGGNPHEELEWRIRAAREAHHRLGPEQEAEHWLRALELWPADAAPQGLPAVSRFRAAFAAMYALEDSAHTDRAGALAESLLPQLGDLAPVDAAALLSLAADYRGVLDSPASGLELIERSIALYETLPPSPDLIRALRAQAGILHDLGRLDEAGLVLDRALALDADADAGDVDQRRRLMVDKALHSYSTGRADQAIAQVRVAAAVRPTGPDPFGDLYVASHHAELLLESGAPAIDVVAAGRPGIEAAAAFGIDSLLLSWLQCTLGSALLRSGDVPGAAALLDAVTEVEVVVDRQPAHVSRADLDVRRGRLEEAGERLDRVAALGLSSLDLRCRWVEARTAVDLWTGEPTVALQRLLDLLREVLAFDESAFAGGTLVLAARAAADARPDARTAAELHGHLTAAHRSANRDPFAPADRPPRGVAEAAAWSAELARLVRGATVEHWVGAAREWDLLGCPHDAAYCRWRAAQVALASGQGTVAARLLRRATDQARLHTPLSHAIQATGGGAQGPR